MSTDALQTDLQNERKLSFEHSAPKHKKFARTSKFVGRSAQFVTSQMLAAQQKSAHGNPLQISKSEYLTQTPISAELSLREHRAQIYSGQNVAQMSSEQLKQQTIQRKLRYGRNYKRMNDQQSQVTQTQTNVELELGNYEKRFSITKCLNNSRIFPTNILAPLRQEQGDQFENQARNSFVSFVNKDASDIRQLWHSGQAHAPVDQITFKQWVSPRFEDQREEPLVKLKVDEAVPYLKDKEEEQRLEHIKNHVKRRNPDKKLQIEIVQNETTFDDTTEELKYAYNQKILQSGNPYRYQILRSDFKSPLTYQMHLINPKDRVTVKTYIPKIQPRTVKETEIKTSSFDGIIRNLKLVPHHVASLNGFNDKFMSNKAVSSQLLKQKGLVYDLGHQATNTKTHVPLNNTQWSQKPKVPIPVYVAATKFKSTSENSNQTFNKTMSVVVPKPLDLQLRLDQSQIYTSTEPPSKQTSKDIEQHQVNVILHSKESDIDYSVRIKHEKALRREMIKEKEERIKQIVVDIVNSGNRQQEAAELIENFIIETVEEQVTPQKLLQQF